MGKKAEDTVIEEEEIITDEAEEEEEISDDKAEEEDEGSEETSEDEEDGGKASDDENEEDEVVVTIGDEAPDPEQDQGSAPEWVRELRKSHRETARENRELKERLAALEKPAPATTEVGKKPTLEEHDYDAEEFEKALTAWHERKRKAEAEIAARKEQQEAEKAEWQERLNTYNESKSKLKVKDYEDAEEVVSGTLNQTQQGIIIHGAENAALVVYALGKNPGRVKELANIKDPVKFAFAVAKLEKDLKVTNRKGPPPPERTVTGTAPKSGTVDSQLERLRIDAAKTGDYTKVIAYKRQKRAKS